MKYFWAVKLAAFIAGLGLLVVIVDRYGPSPELVKRQSVSGPPALGSGDGPATSAAAASPAIRSELRSPRVFLNTTYPQSKGQTIKVAAGGDLQKAFNEAGLGDVIVLEAGATFTGNFVLPKKEGEDWIVVHSSAANADLPPPGTRVTPAFAKAMPKLLSDNSDPVLRTESGAHHYRFSGIEFGVAPGTQTIYNIVALGAGETSLDQVPHDLIIDRCYIHGNATGNARRGLALNSAATAVIDSYISNCHEVGADSQAIAGWNGPGPFKIVNNYLEGAGENFMLGGADPTIPNLIPSDIEFRGNHCVKPLSWKEQDPSYAGTHWGIKNLLELKNAQRVLVELNLFENNWGDAQDGTAILLTPRNQNGTAPWSVVQDVTFTNNIVRHTGSGLIIAGPDNEAGKSQPAQRIRISNNLFDDLGGPRWGNPLYGPGEGRFLLVAGGPLDVQLEHNTIFQTGNIIFAAGAPSPGFTFINNLVPHNLYGVIGDNRGSGNSTLDLYFPGCLFKKNVIIGGRSEDYPSDNFFPASLEKLGFVDLAGGDYHLIGSSPYRKAGTDGTNIGCNLESLNPWKRPL